MNQTTFDRCGLASLDDLSTAEWKSIFIDLESVQTEFLATNPHIPDYPWPRDPLHNFIRVWEYPFAFHHLRRFLEKRTGPQLSKIVDLGSGATFFPFAIAHMGAEVLAIDGDPRAIVSVDRAIQKLSAAPGKVAAMLSDARSLTIESESVDCVYCISVLEHIPDLDRVVAEVSRILCPGGLLVLTFDVGLREGCDLGPEAYNRLLDSLLAAFAPIFSEVVVHPLRVLNNHNSIYPFCTSLSAGARFRRSLHGLVSRVVRLLRSQPAEENALPSNFLAGTYGTCLRKR